MPIENEIGDAESRNDNRGSIDEFGDTITAIRQECARRNTVRQNKEKERFDKKRPGEKFLIGDQFMKREKQTKRSRSLGRLKLKNSGPWTVVGRSGTMFKYLDETGKVQKVSFDCMIKYTVPNKAEPERDCQVIQNIPVSNSIAVLQVTKTKQVAAPIERPSYFVSKENVYF